MNANPCVLKISQLETHTKVVGFHWKYFIKPGLMAGEKSFFRPSSALVIDWRVVMEEGLAHHLSPE